MESERELVTRFRTGSPSLAIKRYSNTPREVDFAAVVSTLWHIFKDCPITRVIIPKDYENLKEAFDDNNIHCTLCAMTRILKIQIWYKC